MKWAIIYLTNGKELFLKGHYARKAVADIQKADPNEWMIIDKGDTLAYIKPAVHISSIFTDPDATNENRIAWGKEVPHV